VNQVRRRKGKKWGHKSLFPKKKQVIFPSLPPSSLSFWSTYLARSNGVGQLREKHVADLRGLRFLRAPPSVRDENKREASGHIRIRLRLDQKLQHWSRPWNGRASTHQDTVNVEGDGKRNNRSRGGRSRGGGQGAAATGTRGGGAGQGGSGAGSGGGRRRQATEQHGGVRVECSTGGTALVCGGGGGVVNLCEAAKSKARRRMTRPRPAPL